MTDINIIRQNNFEYSFKLSTPEGMRHVATALTFDNPDPYAYSHKILCFDKHRFTFRIGMLPTLQKYVKEHYVTYTIKDYDYTMPSGVEIDDRLSGNYIHQRKAVEAFYRHRFGIIVVPTRGGKTFIASEILRIFLNTDSGNFLFIVDSKVLFLQAVKDISGFFERYGGIEIGQICAGNVDLSHRVTVATIQTIQSVLSKRCKDRAKRLSLERYLKDLKFLCIDEIHDNCSDAKLRIYKRCRKLEYQLCLSATPYRAETPIQNLKLKAWSGDVIYQILEDTLRSRHVLSDYKVFLLAIDHNNIDYHLKGCEDYLTLRNKIIYNSDFRNDVLLKTIDFLRSVKLKTLVLFQSIEHGNKISKLTGEKFISGLTKIKEREKTKEEFLKKDGGVLLASDIFKKGVTLPEVRVLINVDAGLENSNTIQKKGRVLGSTKDKHRSLIIDFVDVYDAYFSDHSSARLETYVSNIGEKNVKIIDTSKEQWMKMLQNWTEKWFGGDNVCFTMP